MNGSRKVIVINHGKLLRLYSNQEASRTGFVGTSSKRNVARRLCHYYLRQYHHSPLTNSNRTVLAWQIHNPSYASCMLLSSNQVFTGVIIRPFTINCHTFAAINHARCAFLQNQQRKYCPRISVARWFYFLFHSFVPLFFLQRQMILSVARRRSFSMYTLSQYDWHKVVWYLFCTDDFRVFSTERAINIYWRY